jgi:hypothetical protein
MMHHLRRHPIPMRARFGHSLVVTVAFPRRILDVLLPAGLSLDAYGDWGLAAVAVVEARAMRPAPLPAWFGRDYLLAGYRIFCRFRTPAGRNLRGLYIVRSETNARSMAIFGNMLTHYRYHRSDISLRATHDRLAVEIGTHDGLADLELVADLADPSPLPSSSPFSDERHARRYAGPLPFTFDHEPETGSIVVIEGVRSGWHPRPVAVDLRRADFFRQPCFDGAEPVLATAFHVVDVPYLWRRGRRYQLGAA